MQFIFINNNYTNNVFNVSTICTYTVLFRLEVRDINDFKDIRINISPKLTNSLALLFCPYT